MSRRHMSILFFMAVLIAVVSLRSVPVRAEISIAIVDVQVLLTDSDAAKSIQDQLDAQREKFQEEMAARGKKLRDEEQRLVSMAAEEQEKRAEPSETFLEEKEDFQKDLIETRQAVQERHLGLEKAAREAIAALRREILEIVSGMAETNKYDIVLTKDNVVLAAKALDITQDVMDKLNKEVSRIDVKVETN